MKVLVVGDIVGKPGRTILKETLPLYLQEHGIDFVIANGENAAQGSGITENLFKEIVATGVDCVTCGDHVWRRKEVISILERDRRLLRPLNYPPESAGRGVGVYETRSGVRLGVVTLVGRIFMGPADCPFHAVDRALETLRPDCTVKFVEMHAEATSEKIAMGWKLDGKVSCVFGSHTHVPTSDERILPQGTAYITDIGMTGPHDSVIGRDKRSVLYRFETGMHASFTVATNDVRLSGAMVTVDAQSGQALAIERVLIR
ncbi:MAG: TIGR00282 family metallophosphoesterase [Candidatus Eisenbacteria bacterium]|nr:TIGR00282 family metallophosphoesterase [Candidatus Eisenbacteria bacterium]